MALKLRTLEEIQHNLVEPRNLAIIQTAAKARGFGGPPKTKEHREHDEKIKRLLLKSVFGKRVFSRKHGGAFRAIAEERPHYGLAGDKLRQFGKKLFKGMDNVRWATWALDPEMLKGLNETEQLNLIHYLKHHIEDLLVRGEHFKTFGRWRRAKR